MASASRRGSRKVVEEVAMVVTVVVDGLVLVVVVALVGAVVVTVSLRLTTLT